MNSRLAFSLSMTLLAQGCHEASKQPVHNPDSSTTSLVSICSDVTDQFRCWEASLSNIRDDNNALSFERVGVNGEKFSQSIFSYHFLKIKVPSLSIDQYFEYVLKNIKTPADAGMIVDKFVRWEGDQVDSEKDWLLPPNQVLLSGKGDCDNISNLMKSFLLALGKKNGKDYDPRVLFLPEVKHAVTIFRDEDGVYKSFDQNMPFTSIQFNNDVLDFVSASSLFRLNDMGRNSTEVGSANHFVERFQVGEKGQMDLYYLDPVTLKSDRSLMVIKVDQLYSSSIHPEHFYSKSDWKSFREIQIQFSDVTVFYAMGKVSQIHRLEVVDIYGEDGKLVQKKYVSGDVSLEFFQNGVLTQRSLRNGDGEFYEDGELVQKKYASGNVKFEVFKHGHLVQRTFLSGDTEIYKDQVLVQKVFQSGLIDCEFYENGKLRQRNFRDKRVEWYDENGKVIQRKDITGKVVSL